MKTLKLLAVVIVMILVVSPFAAAGDFDWMQKLNIQAQTDASGFKARLATRFQIGDVKVSTVLSNVERPADAYMILRLGEMSHQPPERILQEYKTKKGKGWGNLAKRLGIKPGSPEFHALKRGHDLDGSDDRGKGKGKGKGKGRNKD